MRSNISLSLAQGALVLPSEQTNYDSSPSSKNMSSLSGDPRPETPPPADHPHFNDHTEAVPEEFHPSSYERGFITSANVGILLCSLGILFNAVLFVVLCRSRRLRLHYLYIQIMSIALADLSFIVMVDSFTIYFEMQPWKLGAAFCKAWMILDVALPGVSLVALLLLNVDRVLFTHKNRLYYTLMRRPLSRAAVILSPWVVSATVVCSLWLGFPEVQPQDGLCMYGITEEANSASSWLMVFLPSLLIFVLIIFVFIAFIGEMPPVTSMTPNSESTNVSRARLPLLVGDYDHNTLNTSSSPASTLVPFPRNSVVYAKDSATGEADADTGGSAEVRLVAAAPSQPYPAPPLGSTLSTRTGATLSTSGQARTHRRFIAALLAVDFFSLAITLPYSAFSLVNPVCTDAQSCASLRSLFQTLSWMRSSAACVRPLLFILLTDIWSSTKHSLVRCYTGRGSEASDNATLQPVSAEADLQLQPHVHHQANGGLDKVTPGEHDGMIALNSFYNRCENIAEEEPETRLDGEVCGDNGQGYTSPDTSVTMENCINSSPKISPDSIKETSSMSLKSKRKFSTMTNEKSFEMFDQWFQEDTAATTV